MGVTVMLKIFGMIEVVERGTPDGLGREREAGGVDDVQPDAQTGPESEQRAGVLRDVRLVEREFDGQDR